MSDVLKAIDAALARKGLSDAAASRLAVGHPSLLKNMRSGQQRFSYEALQSLAKVLDLECYFGPPRASPSSRPGFAEEQTTFHLAQPGPGDPFAALDRQAPADRPFVVHAPHAAVGSALSPYFLVDPARPAETGIPAYVETAGGLAAIGDYLGPAPNGWHQLRFGAAGAVDAHNPSFVRRLARITWSGTVPPPGQLLQPAQPPPEVLSQAALARELADALDQIGRMAQAAKTKMQAK